MTALVAPAARTLVLLAALAGLFAMHGLADHGTSHGSMTGSMSGSPQGPDPAAGHAHDDHTRPTEPTVAGPVAGPVAVVGPLAESAMGLCLAVLAGGLVLLLVRGGAWPARPWSDLVVRRCVAVIARARAPDPPDLLALSIQRC